MKRVLVCFAVKQEAAPFKAPANVTVLVTGMGAANVLRTLPKAIELTRPDVVLTCGFAGALDPLLPIGAVIGETSSKFLTDALEHADIPFRRFHCAERIAVTAMEKAELRSLTGCDAVEMESGTIHQVCAEIPLPCATVRAVSDSASEDLPLDFNQLVDRALNLSPARLALAVLRRPTSIPRLIRLGKNSSLAARNLSLSLSSIIKTIG
jgi:adenosylhomocysteine nucleosidase